RVLFRSVGFRGEVVDLHHSRTVGTDLLHGGVAPGHRAGPQRFAVPDDALHGTNEPVDVEVGGDVGVLADVEHGAVRHDLLGVPDSGLCVGERQPSGGGVRHQLLLLRHGAG